MGGVDSFLTKLNNRAMANRRLIDMTEEDIIVLFESNP